MNFSFSVYDMLANVIPGALQLVALTYIGLRFGWVDLGPIASVSTALQLVVGLGAAMLAGHLIYPLGLAMARKRNYMIEDQVRTEFSNKHPAHANRAFLQMHFNTLVDAIVLYKPDLAAQIDRVGATGIMLRNTVVPSLTVVSIASVELVTSNRPAFAGSVLALSIAAAMAASIGGYRFFRWYVRSIVNLACWVPDIDTLGLATNSVERPAEN